MSLGFGKKKINTLYLKSFVIYILRIHLNDLNKVSES